MQRLVYPVYWPLTYSFIAGSDHTARAQVRNPSSYSQDYNAKLYLGPYSGEEVASATASFSLAPEEEKYIDLLVTMPTAPDVYHVYLDVYHEAELIETFVAPDDVEVTGAPMFTMPEKMTIEITDRNEAYGTLRYRISCLIKNIGAGPGTYIISWTSPEYAGQPGWSFIEGSGQITLNPGETYLWNLEFWRLPNENGTVILTGSWEGNNRSEGFFGLAPQPKSEELTPVSGYGTAYGWVTGEYWNWPIEGANVWEGWFGADTNIGGLYILRKVRPTSGMELCAYYKNKQSCKTISMSAGQVKRVNFTIGSYP